MIRELKIAIFVGMGLISCIGAGVGYTDTHTMLGAIVVVLQLWALVVSLVLLIFIFAFIGSKIFKD